MTAELEKVKERLNIIVEATNPGTLPRQWAAVFGPSRDGEESALTAALLSVMQLPIGRGFSDSRFHSICDSLTNIGNALERSGLPNWLAEAHRAQREHFHEDFLPLARDLLINMRRLVASAAAARAWQCACMGDVAAAEEEIAAAGFPEWFSKSAVPGEEHEPMTPPDWTRSFEELTSACPGTALWVQWWLQNSGRPNWITALDSRSIHVPFACVDGGRGQICELRLWRLSGATARLVQHPSCALYPVAPDWLRPMQLLSSLCPFPVCWEIGCDDIPLARRAFSGPSAGGAAARGFWHLDSEPVKVPDPGVLVLAQLEGAGSKLSPWTTLKLKQVDCLEAKEKAAWDDKSIDTVVEINSAGDMVLLRRRGGTWAQAPLPETASQGR